MELKDVKIVADSSADMLFLEGISFAVAPLKIVTAEKEYVDNEKLNVEEMVNDLLVYKGRSSTACPSPEDWLGAFGDAKYVFCVAITSNLSGSCNSAIIAKKDYEEQYPDRKVCVVDSLSAGPELVLIIEKLRKLILKGKSFEDVCSEVKEYMKGTGLLFILESMKNLANNGRVNPIVAKAAGILGIRAIGRASDVGTLEMLTKSRGERKTVADTYKTMKEQGYKGGKARIGNIINPDAAEQVKALILEEYPEADVKIYASRGLCSFYAEKGGLMVGFEK